MSAIIELQGVSKRYGDKVVLDGVDIAVQTGEVLVILGGSGSGKSVSLRHMNGLEHPDAGRLLAFGQDIAGLSEEELLPVRRKVGMLFQSGALFDSMTVSENVGFALRERTGATEREIAARVREVLELVGLEQDVEPLLPSSLSGGMRKRVSLARTVAVKPEVLLYDEPTSGLDPVTAMTINKLIVDLNQRLSTTSVVVTHDISSALLVGDRLAFLKDGRFRFTGTPDEARESDVPELREFLSPPTAEVERSRSRGKEARP